MAEPAALPRETLRVSDVTRYLKYVIEGDDLLRELSVVGEIAELSRAPSGHVYFSLKDSASQIACVLFRREAMQQAEISKDLRKGLLVVVHGFLTVYEPRGTYQIYVERVVLQGAGDAHRRLEQLTAKLEAEGLFAPDRKRPLPPFPEQLALVTSPGGQAYHDVLHCLRARYPFVRVIEVPVSVQGDGAADEMALALDVVNRLTSVDAILLVRGGGSPEDLQAFNDERLARAVFASRVPVITGVGHETDHTLVDYVADLRAATPSLAAAAAVPNARELVAQMTRVQRSARDLVEQRFRHERRRWLQANQQLLRANPQTRIQVQRKRATDARIRLERTASAALATRRARLQALQAQLGALNPLAVLGRGYAMLVDQETGRAVTSVADVTAGKLLRARVADGGFDVRVESA